MQILYSWWCIGDVRFQLDSHNWKEKKKCVFNYFLNFVSFQSWLFYWNRTAMLCNFPLRLTECYFLLFLSRKCVCYYHLNWLQIFLRMCRSCRPSGIEFVCQEDLQKHQMRLGFLVSWDLSTSPGLLLETIIFLEEASGHVRRPNNWL